MTIKTHYSIAQAGETDNGSFKQGNAGGQACQFFLPCDDILCGWQAAGADGGDVFIPGEAVVHTTAGTGIIRGVTGGTAIIVQDTDSWSGTSNTVTGGTSGSTVAGCNGTLYSAAHDVVGFRGYGSDDTLAGASHSADPLFLNFTACPEYAPVGDAITAPGLNSTMIVAVAERNNAGGGYFSVGGTGTMLFNITDTFVRYNDGSDNYDTGTVTTTKNDSTVHCVAAVINRTTNLLEHWVDGVRVGTVDITAAGTFNSIDGWSLGGATTDIDCYGMTMFTFQDGVPSDLSTWLAEFKANMIGTIVQGERNLPSRWASL